MAERRTQSASLGSQPFASVRSSYKSLASIPKTTTKETAVTDKESSELVREFAKLKSGYIKQKKTETSSSTSTLVSEPLIDAQQSSRIERLHNVFKSVHQNFKTLESTAQYLTQNKPNPEYEIARWELISLAYCVELCVKYEESFLARGKQLVETSPNILTRLQAESDDPTSPHQLILLPPKHICEETNKWIWDSANNPAILVFPTEQVLNDSNLSMLSEHGEVFAELWKAYKNPDEDTQTESLHELLESLTTPPDHALPPIPVRCAILNRLVALRMDLVALDSKRNSPRSFSARIGLGRVQMDGYFPSLFGSVCDVFMERG
ncbi:hypothetical protein BCR33DRAFT_786973 [Rhizoclosmatium globosum]|uniref:Uncharacterized protein n=1 Tax=Rhizoclosmatium globosum TaxID=329046 RepID=A0A1Y2C2U8_9FUNG|nr:hypothetical protein BCR33DRAFT_786973 [Rhizoclosmatium globosum]|eukprot:ORY41217.1 hypothetical protein BCR33DRAFT_786973 [Rhizoclosmatium globosum]